MSPVPALDQIVSGSLPELLERARQAAPSDRIASRDAIAAHGDTAITALAPWLDDPRLRAFAIRAIARAGALGCREQAIEVLRSVDPSAPEHVRTDVADALASLGARKSSRLAGLTSRVASIPVRAGTGWPGWQAREFETTDGTHWRSRDGEASLVPLLLRPLRHRHPALESWPIYHSPVVHIADKGRYHEGGDHAQVWRASKLVVYAHQPATGRPGDDAPKVTAGWWIERGDGNGDAGPVDGRWDWPSLLRALDTSRVRDELARAMVRHDLRLGDYTGGDLRDFEYEGRYEDGELVLRGASGDVVGRGWDALVERLKAAPADRWAGFHIWRSWPAAEAVAAGPTFAGDAMVPVLWALVPVYLDVIQGAPTSAGPAR